MINKILTTLISGAIDGDPIPVETYIKRTGSITRALTAEEARELSSDAHTVDPGQTLIHLALQRHSNHNVLVVLLSHQQQVTALKNRQLIDRRLHCS